MPPMDHNARQAIADGLKTVLADTYALYLKTQNYHWNVTGPLFKPVHELTEEQYTELATAVDEIAERIRALGIKAPGSFAAYQGLTDVTNADENLDAQGMIGDLVTTHEHLVAKNRALYEAADQAGDATTVALLDERLASHEKTTWMLRSFLES